MANIRINDDWRITSDPHSWSIDKAVKRKNKDTGESEEAWISKRWYPNFNAALDGIGEIMLRKSDAKNIDDLAFDKALIDKMLSDFKDI